MVTNRNDFFFFILHSGRFTIYITLDSIKGIQWTVVSIVITTCIDLYVDTRDPPFADASTNTGTLSIIFHWMKFLRYSEYSIWFYISHT